MDVVSAVPCMNGASGRFTMCGVAGSHAMRTASSIVSGAGRSLSEYVANICTSNMSCSSQRTALGRPVVPPV